MKVHHSWALAAALGRSPTKCRTSSSRRAPITHHYATSGETCMYSPKFGAKRKCTYLENWHLAIIPFLAALWAFDRVAPTHAVCCSAGKSRPREPKRRSQSHDDFIPENSGTWGGRDNRAWETPNSSWKCLICFSLDPSCWLFAVCLRCDWSPSIFCDARSFNSNLEPSPSRGSLTVGNSQMGSVREELAWIHFAMLYVKPCPPFKPPGSLVYYKYEQVKLFGPTV